MLDRVTGMQVFARVAALGSLSAAGRALGMSQTMATKHIAALEERLGVKLLHRTTRRLTLTEAGRRYLESVERVLAEIEETEAAAAAERVEVTGTLRVNVPVSFGVREIAPLMAEFSRLHPALTVEMGLSDRMVDLVDEGWDLAVRIGRIRDETMIARKLAPCRTLVAGAPLYLAEHGIPQTVAELQDYNGLGYTLSHPLGSGRWAFGRHGAVTVPIRGTFMPATEMHSSQPLLLGRGSSTSRRSSLEMMCGRAGLKCCRWTIVSRCRGCSLCIPATGAARQGACLDRLSGEAPRTSSMAS
jgi:DNA-binding transcriptional LysR family regulator